MQSKDKHTVILIVTSYRQYLDDAMDINVTRYIDKPVTQGRIFSALDKALSIINESIITFTTKDNQIIRLRCSDIVYAEAKFKSVYVYTKTHITESRNQSKTAYYFKFHLFCSSTQQLYC